MNREAMTRAVIVSTTASILGAPAIVTVGRSFGGPVHPGAILVGALLSTVFFVISGAMAVVTWERTALKKPLLTSYGIKIVLLLVVGIFLSKTEIDRGAFAAGAVASAVTYLFVQVIVLSKRSFGAAGRRAG